tara:strand:+ start:55 stop:627 length:573 start_codon:yes stop_codon:yes gene_type:complete
MPYTREQAESQKKYREANKEKLAEKNRKYREANREKLAEAKKQYRENNKEKINEAIKQYRENNKEKLAEAKKQYRENNREKINEKQRKYHEDNKEKLNENKKQYHQTPIGKRISRICRWKREGIKLPEEYGENWDIFYEEEYLSITNCEECGVKLTVDKKNTSTTKCLDHNHITGDFRNILCQACNIQRG